MDLNSHTITVIGAGIGGLTTALVLRRLGAKVRVLEQASEISEIGAGLQVSPNGFAVLNALGLADTLRNNAVRGTQIRLRDYSGKPVVVLNLALSGHSDYYFVHRADLLEILLTAARETGVKLETGFQASEVAPGAKPIVKNQDGTERHADLIVGADGLHSVARQALNGTLAPFFTQHVAWRATIPEHTEASHVDLFMGPNRHIVSYPLRGGQLRNIVAVQKRLSWVAESWSQADDPNELRAAFTDFGSDVQALLDRVEEVKLWGLFRHPVAPVWHKGNVVLVGDAAHPTLPFLAQGANMALEDAWVLGRCLSEGQDLLSALARYQNQRQGRATKIVDAASKNAWKYHLKSQSVRFAAHTGLRLLGRLAPKRLISQFDWIYGRDVTKS